KLCLCADVIGNWWTIWDCYNIWRSDRWWIGIIFLWRICKETEKILSAFSNRNSYIYNRIISIFSCSWIYGRWARERNIWLNGKLVCCNNNIVNSDLFNIFYKRIYKIISHID